MKCVKYFLKLDFVKGTATQSGHEKEIELIKFQTIQTDKSVLVIDCDKYRDRASPSLLLAAKEGSHFGSAVLSVEGYDGEIRKNAHRITMRDVLIKEFMWLNNAASKPTIETFKMECKEFAAQ